MNDVNANQLTNSNFMFPGEFLEKTLAERGLSQSDLAKRTGFTPKTINGIVKGTAPISPDTAIALERVLGISARDWLSLEADYQINKINSSFSDSMEEEVEFLKKIDLKSIIKEGWVEKFDSQIEQIQAVLSFFGVSSVRQLSQVWSNLEVNYKTSQAYHKNHANIMLWLRRGELLANDIICESFNVKKFKIALEECRALTNFSFVEVKPRIQELCASAGVAVVFVPCIKNVSTSGAAQWLSKDKALIQLSLRGKKDDLFWFSFFHEAGHILLHGRKDQFIDSNTPSTFNSPIRQLIEAEADDFSANMLVPKKKLLKFIEGDVFSCASITDFAERIGIAPGIVLGQLQKHEVVSWSSVLNKKLKKTYEFPK